MKEKLYFSIYDELMNETKCEILTTFILTKTNKNYIIYTDNKKDNEGKLKVYAAIFDPNDESVFEEVKTNYEWQEINKIIETLGVVNNE